MRRKQWKGKNCIFEETMRERMRKSEKMRNFNMNKKERK